MAVPAPAYRVPFGFQGAWIREGRGNERAAAEGLQAVAAATASGELPGAAAAVVDRKGIVGVGWGGWALLPAAMLAVRDPVRQRRRETDIQGIHVGPATRFDLASLTKVIVTLPIVSWLAEHQYWSLDDLLSHWLPEAPWPGVTLRHCLTHTSGLPAHQRLFRTAVGRGAMHAALFAVHRVAAPGEAMIYADVNYLLLGLAAQRCAGSGLDVLARRLVFDPLGLRESGFVPESSEGIAATEWSGEERSRDQGYRTLESGTPERMMPERGGIIRGRVHDGNAHALGGIAGHAGLFAPIADVAHFAGAVLAAHPYPVASSSLRSNRPCLPSGLFPSKTTQPAELGWALAPLTMAPGWPEDTFGHTGFTGTSILVSPSLGVAAVLLSNVIHPVRPRHGALAARRAFHAAVRAQLLDLTGAACPRDAGLGTGSDDTGSDGTGSDDTGSDGTDAAPASS